LRVTPKGASEGRVMAQAVAVAADVHDVAVVQEAVDERGRDVEAPTRSGPPLENQGRAVR
ncbi:MAG TPA: hypothetical protein VGB15_09670, partial [Longimicrobium sp.]